MSTTTKTPKTRDTILTGSRANDRGPRLRPRRKGLLAFATLVIVASALAGAIVVNRAGSTVDVLAVRDSVGKGHTITRGDLITKSVTGIDGAYASDGADAVVGSTAVVDLVAGQVITRAMVSKTPTPGPGKATVGLDLDPSRVPSAGLKAGDEVDVIAVPGGKNSDVDGDALDAPPVLADDAQVYKVTGSATEGGGLLVTIIVDQSASGRIAAYSTAGKIAIIETAPGGGVSS